MNKLIPWLLLVVFALTCIVLGLELPNQHESLHQAHAQIASLQEQLEQYREADRQHDDTGLFAAQKIQQLEASLVSCRQVQKDCEADLNLLRASKGGK